MEVLPPQKMRNEDKARYTSHKTVDYTDQRQPRRFIGVNTVRNTQKTQLGMGILEVNELCEECTVLKVKYVACIDQMIEDTEFGDGKFAVTLFKQKNDKLKNLFQKIKSRNIYMKRIRSRRKHRKKKQK